MTRIHEVRNPDWGRLSQRRIFFGHQSVGQNILSGVSRVLATNPQVFLRTVRTLDPSTVDGPALFECNIGKNRQPLTKAEEFERILDMGFGSEPNAVAMFKYCYIDIQHETDVDALFADYVSRVERIQVRFPDLTLIHITVPLHRADGVMEEVRTLMGRPTQTVLNSKRSRYNELLRGEYQKSSHLFDLAKLQSTRANGTHSSRVRRGQIVQSLCADWTDDGGHLNAAGQERIAEQLLVMLAELPD